MQKFVTDFETHAGHRSMPLRRYVNHLVGGARTKQTAKSSRNLNRTMLGRELRSQLPSMPDSRRGPPTVANVRRQTRRDLAKTHNPFTALFSQLDPKTQMSAAREVFEEAEVLFDEKKVFYDESKREYDLALAKVDAAQKALNEARDLAHTAKDLMDHAASEMQLAMDNKQQADRAYTDAIPDTPSAGPNFEY